MVTHPAPPQTRTCAMHAYGASSRAAAALMQSTGLPWSGLVSSMSLPCLPPADALPDGAFPPVGRLGLTSPPAAVRCAATTAASPSRGASLVARLPDTLPASIVRGVPDGLVTRRKLQGTPGPVVTRSPHSGYATRRQAALPRSRVPPMDPCPALRPRWCPAHSPSRAQDCGLPARANRRLSPPTCGISCCPRLYTCRGSITRPASSRHPASYGPLRGGTRVRS